MQILQSTSPEISTTLQAELDQLHVQLEHDCTARRPWHTDAQYAQHVTFQRAHYALLVRAAEYPEVVISMQQYSVVVHGALTIERRRVDQLDNLHVYFTK